MHAQLAAICDELEAASQRLHTLAGRMTPEAWGRRPDSARWSASECVAHLNLTSVAYLPLLDGALARAPRETQRSAPAPRRYRRDLLGWMLWKSSGPAPWFRLKTAPSFVPIGGRSRDEQIAEFDRLQSQLIERVRRADGLAVDRVNITSPFDPRAKYNLYAALTILPRHQHRHLWQAEQVWQALHR
jgi:hypothetical protein